MGDENYTTVIENTEKGILRNIPDWTETAFNGAHLWVPSSEDFCCLGENCKRFGAKIKCSVCNIVIHQNCISALLANKELFCKPSFVEGDISLSREKTIDHHWIFRCAKKCKCKHCGKSLQSKYKDVVSCSWCKIAFHSKSPCFDPSKTGKRCDLGVHASIIIPPSWIIKIAKSSFIIRPIPSSNQRPIIVFINPKSGGNQGLKLLQKFQYLLNPRQVFDLTQGGPKLGLELFRKVANLRVLTCGGDGTVGWVLSTIDQIGISPAPAVGVLPLGTGNDLARALGWGGGYTDEPISKILYNTSISDVVLLDRWSLEVEANPQGKISEEGKENLPLNVVNNYFSLGVDAHIALEFHEAREAHPEKFNSRLRNKMFYGQMGGKDLLKRKWKDLTDFITLECDGKDLTSRIKALKVHAIVFLNISSYGGGTHPWNKSSGSLEPSTEDGVIEVVGLTTYQLPMLQAGSHGTCITQCKSAKITTLKTIPMQVDGEACKLNPSIIKLSLLNKAAMLARKKGGFQGTKQTHLKNITIMICIVKLNEYEQHHCEKKFLSQTALTLGEIEVNPTCDLQQVRDLVNKLMEKAKEQHPIITEWCYLDSCTAGRFYRIDKAQENLHYVLDICSDNLYILDCDHEVVLQSSEDVTSPNSPHVIPSDEISEKIETEKDEDEDVENTAEISIEDKESLEHCEYRTHIFKNFTNSGKLIIKKNTPQQVKEAFLKAAKAGDLRKIKQLNFQGNAFLLRDSNGQTALHYASRYGHIDVVKYLLTHAPPTILHIKDINFGQTALHKAAAYKFRKICCVLIAAGAFLNVPDDHGLTPKILAVKSNDHELAAYLECQEHFQELCFHNVSSV